MQKRISWKAYAKGDRQEVIRMIQDTISGNDGCIMNFNMFSDLAMSLSVEIEENKVVNLYDALKEEIELSDFDEAGINQQSEKECLIFVNVSFSSGEGKLKMNIPEVPG